MSKQSEDVLIEIRDLLKKQNEMIGLIKDMNQASIEESAKSLIESNRYLERNEKLQKANTRNNIIFSIVFFFAAVMIFWGLTAI